MAPKKKPGSMNKQISSLNEDSPEKDEANSNKNKQWNRKLSDKLGSQWKKEELERFYEAYRKYGKDWKKVAAVVRNRSAEMVEALHNMNQAYLSLPEGAASVVGLIAMMTDHYNVLEESDSERQSKDVSGSRKPLKRKRGKIQLLSVSNDSVLSQSKASDDGCLSLLRNGSLPHAVGKRTPRVPVNYSNKKDDTENYVLPNKSMKSGFDANDDEAAYIAALALTEAAQRGSSPQVSLTLSKRSKQKSSPVQSGERMVGLKDESSALDALKTLADLSLMIPASTMESESSVHLNEEKMTVDKDEKSALPEGTSTSQNRDKIKLLDLKQKVAHAVPGVEVSTSKKSKLGRESVNNTNALLQSKEQLPSLDRSGKRRRKLMISKAVEEKDEKAIKGKHTDQFFTQAKQFKSVRSSERDLRVSTAEIPLVSGVNSSTGPRSRHKTILKISFAPKEKSSENIWTSKPNKNLIPAQDWALFLKEKLSGCLSSYMARRWCIFEWFYSAIDYPWFSKREFIEYLNHVDLGNIPRLTRVEWSVIKSSLGKPRRLSECFLRVERQKLKQYRESVRRYYNELWAGTRDGLPVDLAKPLYVGQKIIALHSKTREIHDGSVLTVDHDKYRVQFDRPELGVESVMDIDCMPLNPLDNMPELLRWKIGAGNVPCRSEKAQRKGNLSVRGRKTWVSRGPVEKALTSSKTLAKQKKGDVNHSIAQSKAAITDQFCPQQAVCTQSCTVINDQTKEADIHALSKLARAPDKKEKLLTELKNANSDIMENQNDANCFKDSEALKKHYPMVVAQLKEADRRALSSTKEGEDAFTRIGQVLDCVDYQQLASNSRRSQKFSS